MSYTDESNGYDKIILIPRISKKAAKIRLRMTGDIRCAIHAPTGANKTLATTILKKAGKLT